MTIHRLPGVRPTPLASYLSGLGLIRLLGEQADPSLTAWWTDDGLVIDTTVSDLAAWLADDYVPTPVLNPWNKGSGFDAKDTNAKRVIATLTAMPGPRLEPFRRALEVATVVGERYRSGRWHKDEAKQQAVREFRNLCPEEVLPWIDATVVLAGDQVHFPPLLGTGGNDGRLDFSSTFHKRLVDVLTPKRHARSLALAVDLLSGTQNERLAAEPVGQFDPGGAGGRNSSPFGGGESLVNPWAFVLLVEGALLFAASAARRHLHGARRAAVPFTVAASPDGSPSGAEGENSRGEVWAPVWQRPFAYPEIRQLFAEARATWNGRPAQRAAEFYAATHTLGVARGIASFQRYGLQQRNGLAFVAVPLDRVEVRHQPAVRLAARLEDWVSRVRRGEPSSAVGRALRRFERAHLEFVREGEPKMLAHLLAALTDLELAVGRSGRARQDVPVRRPPSARDFLAEFRHVDAPEMRVAVGLASCATVPGPGEPARSMRHLLLPVDPDGRWRSAPVVPGLGLRPLTQVLADVLVWRGRTASGEPAQPAYRGVPGFRRGIPVPAADLHDLAANLLDEQQLHLWLRACLALHWQGVTHTWPDADVRFPVPTLALLAPFTHGLSARGNGSRPGGERARADLTGDQESAASASDSDAAERRSGGGADRASDGLRFALGADWAARLAAGQVAAVHDEAVRRLDQLGWYAAPAVPGAPVDGAAIAAALVPRSSSSLRFLSYFAVQKPALAEELS